MLARIPTDTPLVSGQPWLLSLHWAQWFRPLVDAVDRAAQRVSAAVALVAQGASVGPVAATPALRAGLYRVSIHARITQAATVSSSLTVSVGYTDGGVACSQAGAALTGNTTATVQGLVFVVKVDANSVISYTATRASAGATAMQFGLGIVIEALPS